MSENDQKIEVKKATKENKQSEGKKERELTVRRESPFNLFQQMDRIFDDLNNVFFDDRDWPFVRRRHPLSLIIREDEPLFRTPKANITETEDAFHIISELPGMDKADLEITLQAGNLEIRAEKKQEEKEEKEGQLIRREFRKSSYYRAFSLPENIDENSIDAKLENGLLNIQIPKVIPPKPEKKSIEVK